MDDIFAKRCLPCEGGVNPLTPEQITSLMSQIPEWQLNAEQTEISRHYQFKNFYQTMAFVNAVAWIAHREDHHPDMIVGYNECTLKYSTHSIKGLTENDFICAAKINQLSESVCQLRS